VQIKITPGRNADRPIARFWATPLVGGLRRIVSEFILVGQPTAFDCWTATRSAQRPRAGRRGDPLGERTTAPLYAKRAVRAC
jgi:hypothetical protein